MPTDRATITPEIVARFAAYFRENPVWGSMHIDRHDERETPQCNCDAEWTEGRHDVDCPATEERNG